MDTIEQQSRKHEIIAQDRVIEGVMGREAWARYLARICDLYLGMYILIIIPTTLYMIWLTLVFSDNVAQLSASWMSGLTGRIVLTVLVGAVWLFIEAVIISMYGTTPFKALLGLRVLNEDESKLTIVQSLRRNVLVLLQGMGLRLPLISIVTLLLAYVDLNAFGRSCWDRRHATCVIKKPVGKWRWALVITIYVLFTLFTVSRLQKLF